MVLVILIFFADHRATVFTLSKTFETAQKKILRRFFAMKWVRERSNIYFVSLDIHLHSSILTHRYLWTGPYVAPFFFFKIVLLSTKYLFIVMQISEYDH